MGKEAVRCIIIGSAPVLDSGAFLSLLKPDDYVICADGGLKFANEHNIVPSLIVGDFDSYSGSFPNNTEILTLPHIKDDTDLHFAAKEAFKRGYRSFVITGVTGGKRPEHTFAALSTLAYLVDKNCSAFITDGISNYYIINNNIEIKKPNSSCYVSLFPFDGIANGVTISGVFYPLDDAVLDNNFPLGVSNEITEKVCNISVKKGRLIVITSPY